MERQRDSEPRRRSSRAGVVEGAGGGEELHNAVPNCSVDANPLYYFNNLGFTACTRIICLQTRLFGEGGSGVISCFGAFIYL